MFSLEGKRIWVAGHKGMAGSAIARRLQREHCEVLTVERSALDLCRQADVEGWMAENRPEVVFVAAALVGGIQANNSRPAEFLHDNITIETNIIRTAWTVGVKKLIFLGSSCIYPRLAEQPMREDALLTGLLEPTNEAYAIAKIAGVKLCQAYRRQYGCDFISAMPTNLCGFGDNFDVQGGHVAAALMVKIHRAKEEGAEFVELWGTGTPLREFLFVDDLADGLVFLAKNYSDTEHVNIGTGKAISIRALAELLAEVIGYQGRFRFDTSKPDGMPRKALDVSRMERMGWVAATPLRSAFEQTYRWFLETLPSGALRGLPGGR